MQCVVLSVFIAEVDIVYPVILAACCIVVCIYMVAVCAAEITKDLLIHDSDLTLDGTLTIADICLRCMHDSPAAESVIAECRELIICRPFSADRLTVLGSQCSVVIRIVTACFSSCSAKCSTGSCCRTLISGRNPCTLGAGTVIAMCSGFVIVLRYLISSGSALRL